ncbi:ribosomal-protein-serine acetyltransferase [Evansella caseinilytica]|uniref:Ribosomal-protein-serine acetyltransferase n=1 Tax=Evansella caseinilytica TaxID=1503961 RepID=A0A1H3U196_9BACI|nr:GNAT family protein [Evansella caseinilytica]SDZ56230.1 ribosomal-protein-serine acetyltransferase [Evansella caseinilytica]
MFVYKIDDEVSLKLIDQQDAECVFALTDQSRDSLKEWLPWLDVNKTLEDTRSFIASSMKNYAEQKSLNTVIVYKGEAAGVAGFNETDWVNKVAYIGYWLGNDYQGRGIMTRAAAGLTTYAFEVLKMNRVDIRAAEGNKKSRAIPERLGFREEGRIRQAEWLYDHYVDHIVYGMLKKDWKVLSRKVSS